MELGDNVYIDWLPSMMLEVELKEPDDFLKIRETLTRIGISSKRENVLYQTCHILHKQHKYYIVHFKELFCIDGKPSNITVGDVERRNTIAILLQEWGLVKMVTQLEMEKSSLSSIKIVPYREKKNWQFVAKYTLGKK